MSSDSVPRNEAANNKPVNPLDPQAIEELIESITQEVAGDSDELTYAQAQEITWRLAQALHADQRGGPEGGDE